MAFSRIVPMTRRDFFWDDPFFSNVWDDFEKMRTDIWKGHEDFFSRFNQQEKALQNEAESFMNKNSKNESRIMEKSMKKSSSKFEKDFSSSTSDATNSDFGRSRSWLMPKGFFDEDFSSFSDLIPKTLLTPQLKDEVLRVKDDENKFEVSIDTHGYKPEDLQVKIKDNVVSIEAKSEEKKEEPNSKSYACKKFARSFTLPQGCKMQSVTSNLSKDGLLIVSAPKVEAIQQTSSRKVPIEMKKF